MLLQSAKITTRIVASQTNAKDLSTPQADIVRSIEQSYADGTGADQAQIVWGDTRTLGSSASESLDLAGGLTHELGGTITFTAIKEIIIEGDEDNTGNLRVGAGVANAFVGPFGASAIGNLVGPLGLFHQRDRSATGWAVTAGTGDLLRIENLVAATANYNITIIGEGSVA
jgi:hypothetical protein